MEDTGKKGLGQKLKDKLHIGHSHKGSAASDESSYSNQGPLGSAATTESSQQPRTAAGMFAGQSTAPGNTGTQSASGAGVAGSNSSRGAVSGTSSNVGTPGSTYASQGTPSGKESHGLEDSRERKHVEADSVERGYNESFSVGPEFNRAAEFARKAAEESASANAESKEAYKRAEEAKYYRKEAGEAELKLTEAQARLRETQMNIPNVNAVQQQTQMAESMVSRNAALAEESIRAAEATAAEARRKYEAAKLAADEAERARLAAESLSQEAQARRAGLLGADEAAARVREEARLMRERAAEARSRLQSTHAELVEAQAIAEEKARELAVANGLVAEKTRQYAEVQRIATESEQSAAALEDKFKMQMLETRAERESLKDIEVRLLAAEEAAREAKDVVVGQADIAKVERERALASRAEAEQANMNLDSARHLAALKQRELENARVTAEEMEKQMAPLRQSVNEYQTASETKYASAESSAREWAEVTARANMHKGKWSEYWEEAKAAGDMGNEKANIKYEEMREKAGEAVPDKIKEMVQSHDNDMNAEHSSKATSQNYDSAKETGPNADIGKVEGVYEGGRSGNQGENLLDKTKESAYNKMGGGTSGSTQSGNNVTGSNQTGRLGQGTQGSTSGY